VIGQHKETTMLFDTPTAAEADPGSKVVDISPDLAREWLEAERPRNRNVNPNDVAAIARDIADGRWVVNGDAIRFCNGQLIDGQHRLTAVLEAGKTIRSLVVWGLGTEAFPTIDSGRKRTGADVLASQGEANAATLSATVRLIDEIKRGRIDSREKCTNARYADLLAKFPGARRSVSVSITSRKLVGTQVMAACHFCFAEIDAAAADHFVSRLLDGDGLEKDSPIYLLRERLLMVRAGRGRTQREYVVACFFKSWNAMRRGQRSRSLKMAPDESLPVLV
jgi:hypothetical protein